MPDHAVNALTEQILGACIEVHRHLGPGLLESAYEDAVAHELTLLGLTFVRQFAIEAFYKGRALGTCYRADLIVEEVVVLELKAIEQLLPVHGSQLLTYLRLSGFRVGLLINFNVPLLRHGIRRIANNAPGLDREMTLE